MHHTLQNATFDIDLTAEQEEILLTQVQALEISIVNACTAMLTLAQMNVDPISLLGLVADRIELRLAGEESGTSH